MQGKERELQEKWEVARWIEWQEMLLSPNIKPNNKPKSAKTFYPFPWEKESLEEMEKKAEQYRVTDEEIKELNRIIADWEATNSEK